MNEAETIYTCLNCRRSEDQIPLVSMRHSGKQIWICSQCLPVLIHNPQRLVGKLERADQITPVPPDSH
jgi:Zn-finger protein